MINKATDDIKLRPNIMTALKEYETHVNKFGGLVVSSGRLDSLSDIRVNNLNHVKAFDIQINVGIRIIEQNMQQGKTNFGPEETEELVKSRIIAAKQQKTYLKEEVQKQTKVV